MKTNELTGAALDWPERESLADLEYAQTTPEDWTEDYKQCWQQLQVCERNKIILWKHAKTLKGAVEYERAEKVKYFKLYNDVCETAQLRLQEIARLDASLKNSAPPQRVWQGLTAKDLAEIPPSCFEGAVWADAKLREKNT